ncbi:MAG: hypothetical protein U9O98_04070 [Asgard group archaeon]|nr:hypothetical protein [Asgard group archaeon]
MVGQIIVSREDSTSFFSIGSVKDDASLVSALGGALTNFAIEMGLSDTRTSNANYSKFQNGVLISKQLSISDHSPSLLIAVKDLGDLEQYHYLFLIEYGSVLAETIIKSFERMYDSQGAIPHLQEIRKYVPQIAHQLFKYSPSTCREFAEKSKVRAKKLLETIWEEQNDKSQYDFPFRNKLYHPTKIDELFHAFVKYYYLEGLFTDALFPLVFAETSSYQQSEDYLKSFFTKQAQQSKADINSAIKKIVNQLRVMSQSRSRRGKEEVESVDLINADILFEKISVAELEDIKNVSQQLLNDLFETLLQRLYQNYPLKFIAAGMNTPIDKSYIKKVFLQTINSFLEETFSETERLAKDVAKILRRVVSDYNPEQVLKRREQILQEVQRNYLKSLKKDDPFLFLADAKLTRLTKISAKFAAKAFDQFQTAHDEAMVWWYILNQLTIYKKTLKTTTMIDLTRLHFLQILARNYQFRNIPTIVYDVFRANIRELVLSKRAKDPVKHLVTRMINMLTAEQHFSIPTNTKRIVLERLTKEAKGRPTFENIEALGHFTKAFKQALEQTIVYLLGRLFGSKKHIQPPKKLVEAVQSIIKYSQCLFSLGNIFQALLEQPQAKELLQKKHQNYLKKTIKMSSFFPPPVELARIAYEHMWIIDQEKITTISPKLRKQIVNNPRKSPRKDISNISDKELLKKKIALSQYQLQGSLSKILKDPFIIVELLVLFGEEYYQDQQDKLKQHYEVLAQKAEKIPDKKKQQINREIKQVKHLLKVFHRFIAGGNFFTRLFSSNKRLENVLKNQSVNIFSGLKSYPSSLKINSQKEKIFGKKIVLDIDPMIGSFEKLLEVYSSIWVKDSEFTRNLKEQILWQVLDQSSRKQRPLEREIIENLHKAASKGGRGDQETVVRKTIEQAVSLKVNSAIRQAISALFIPLKEDILVLYNQKEKYHFMRIFELPFQSDLSLNSYEMCEALTIVQKGEKKTELQLNLTELLPDITTRSTSTQSLRTYLRDGVLSFLRQTTFKAISMLSELTEKYIGEQTADKLYKHSQILEQLFLESIDES